MLSLAIAQSYRIEKAKEKREKTTRKQRTPAFCTEAVFTLYSQQKSGNKRQLSRKEWMRAATPFRFEQAKKHTQKKTKCAFFFFSLLCFSMHLVHHQGATLQPEKTPSYRHQVVILRPFRIKLSSFIRHRLTFVASKRATEKLFVEFLPLFFFFFFLKRAAVEHLSYSHACRLSDVRKPIISTRVI